MGVDFTEAEKNLRDLIKWYSDNAGEQTRNEATTRLHLIDRLLFGCLGWDYENCEAEARLDGQITDYSFHCPECLFILEAKKEGTYFELPIGEKKKILYDIRYFSRYARDVHEAIEQASNYCQRRGTPYGAVCNGHQLIVFLGGRIDGRPPLEGKALVFDSLQSILDNFLFVWQRLSKKGIESHQLYVELAGSFTVPVPEKLSSKLSNYPGFKQRNILQTDLQILAEIFIEDIARLGEKDEAVRFLRECYCRSGALSQYASVSKDLLRARYSVLFKGQVQDATISPATTKKGINPELIAQSMSRRPILLIGDVGVGKTMFIQHFCQVEAADILSNALVLYIDFAISPTVEQDLEVFIANELERQLNENYGIDIYDDGFVRGVLHGELQRFRRGIYGGLHEKEPEVFKAKELEFIEEKLGMKDDYLKRCMNQIQRGYKKQIVAFLDNVDRRSDEFQERVFLIGQAMASNWPIAVYISIRPETFYKSKISGTLDAYHPRAFTIGPPRVDEVVKKRLEYGISLLTRGKAIGLEGMITVRAPTLIDYLKVLVYSFEKSRLLTEFLDNMCGGNIRLALEFVRTFIASGHVDTGKILNIYHDTGRYLVPLHEFLRAIIYVDNEYYSPASSEIVNLFDISAPDAREHFLSPILLAQLGRLAQQSDTDGFITISEIYSYLQNIGFNPSQINWAIDRLTRRKLIESPAKSSPHREAESPSHYRITTIGAYYVKRLIGQFEYVDAMIVDTPILDANLRARLIDVSDIAERLTRANIFCDYLDSIWAKLAEQPLVFDWPSAKNIIKKNIDYIQGKVSIREDVPPPPLNTS